MWNRRSDKFWDVKSWSNSWYYRILTQKENWMSHYISAQQIFRFSPFKFTWIFPPLKRKVNQLQKFTYSFLLQIEFSTKSSGSKSVIIICPKDLTQYEKKTHTQECRSKEKNHFSIIIFVEPGGITESGDDNLHFWILEGSKTGFDLFPSFLFPVESRNQKQKQKVGYWGRILSKQS